MSFKKLLFFCPKKTRWGLILKLQSSEILAKFDEKTMKTLYLVRHAEAGFESEDYSDFKRKLTARGEHSATLLGQDLSKRNIKIDKICASAALRTAQTAQRIAHQIHYPTATIELDMNLYNTEFFVLLNFVNHLDDIFDHVLLINHNPTITNFVSYLINAYFMPMKPATIAELHFDFESWNYISKGTAKLVRWESF